MLDLILKFFSSIAAVFIMILNMFGNLIGIGDIFPVEPAEPEREEIVLSGEINDDVDEVLAYYNAAVIETDKNPPKGESSFELDGEVSAGSLSPEMIDIITPVLNDSFEESVSEVYDIPGEGKLKAEDVVSAQMSSSEGQRIIIIEVKDQVDGIEGDALNGGPVSRAVGTMGNLEAAFEALGAEIVSGADTVEITYSDCVIACIVDEETGEIVYGDWDYKINLYIGNVELNIQNLAMSLTELEFTLISHIDV